VGFRISVRGVEMASGRIGIIFVHHVGGRRGKRRGCLLVNKRHKAVGITSGVVAQSEQTKRDRLCWRWIWMQVLVWRAADRLDRAGTRVEWATSRAPPISSTPPRRTEITSNSLSHWPGSGRSHASRLLWAMLICPVRQADKGGHRFWPAPDCSMLTSVREPPRHCKNTWAQQAMRKTPRKRRAQRAKRRLGFLDKYQAVPCATSALAIPMAF